jgi:hypothetical protein
VRYDVVDGIITNKDYWFHKQQVSPSVLRCMNGKCNEYLCHQLDEQFVLAVDAYIPGDNQKDPVIGKLVKISEHGFMSFCDPDGDNHKLNLKEEVGLHGNAHCQFPTVKNHNRWKLEN